MEGAKYFITISLLLIFSVDAGANRKDAIYQSFISSDMTTWKLVIDDMQ
jgi:hypothetical protein